MKARLLATVLICMLAPSLSAAQDASNGEKLFKKCASCHKIGESAKNGVGPVLTGVIGRKAATFEGYKYSKTLIASREMGLVWDEASVEDYIADPRKFMRNYLDDPKAKPKMTFKLKKEADRKDVVAFLVSLGATEIQGSNEVLTEPEQEIAINGGAVCVMNGSEMSFFFTVENASGVRSVAQLEKSEFLCSEPGQSDAFGTVSVFESDDAFEGCSRRVAAGSVEIMYRYSEFDRCEWSSNRI
jgi:cytochrome c2